MAFLCRRETLEAGHVVRMTAPEGGDQNGSIEELFHQQSLFSDRFRNGAEAVFALVVDNIDDGGVRRFSLVDPDAELLLKHDVLADRAESDALAFRFQMERISGSELQAVTKRLGQNDAASLVESKLGGHNGIIEWEKPIVNGILYRDMPVCGDGCQLLCARRCKMFTEGGARRADAKEDGVR
jgi:hypothetical protein